MNKTRLEAFSDGVLAIIVTIMVLELKIPHEASLTALAALLPAFFSYLLSFVFIGIYWGSHHHLFYTVHHVNSKIIWSNMALLFFLSLVPFTTGWMGENHFDKLTIIAYAVNMLICGVSYAILQKVIITHHTHDASVSRALKKQQKKGLISMVLYIASVIFSFFQPLVSILLFVTVSVMWIIPDKNIEDAAKSGKD